MFRIYFFVTDPATKLNIKRKKTPFLVGIYVSFLGSTKTAESAKESSVDTFFGSYGQLTLNRKNQPDYSKRKRLIAILKKEILPEGKPQLVLNVPLCTGEGVIFFSFSLSCICMCLFVVFSAIGNRG